MRVEHGRLIVEDGEDRPTHWGGIRILYDDDFPCHLEAGEYVMATNVYMPPILLEKPLRDVTIRTGPMVNVRMENEATSRVGGVSGELPAQRLRLAVRRIVDRRRRRMRLLDTRTENTPNASEDYP